MNGLTETMQAGPWRPNLLLIARKSVAESNPTYLMEREVSQHEVLLVSHEHEILAAFNVHVKFLLSQQVYIVKRWAVTFIVTRCEMQCHLNVPELSKWLRLEEVVILHQHLTRLQREEVPSVWFDSGRAT